MAELFANPNLPNYFVEASDVTSLDDARSFVADYEAAKVITFANLKVPIDHEFWSGLDTDKHSFLKKYSFNLDPEDHCGRERQFRNLNRAAGDEGLANFLSGQFDAILDTLLPIYRKVFAEYEFDESRKKVVWRLNTIMNQNMHVDIYKEENEYHFARMFVNLDAQPRIWQTSWTIDDIIRNLDGRINPDWFQGKSRAEIWMKINYSTFGQSTREWWDREPRHVAYFQPGDIWIVDSRQVAHQIFYGRRALSIDFSVPKSAMKDSSRHYLAITDRFRDAQLRELVG